MKKQGFTIVEMLMVIAILGILVTLVTVSSSAVIRKSRVRRTDAMKMVLRAGFATYYTQKGEWPGQIKNYCDNGATSSYSKKHNVVYLTDSEADTAIQKLVTESANGNPMLDVSGLFVAQSGSAGNKNASGMDFRAAKMNGGKRSRISTNQMAFGYPESEKGRFRRFVVKYNFLTDSVDVLTQSEYHDETDATWPAQPTD
ncbi:MAG: type II secretion system GspH family protein [Kiritimatiellae bacterium]|nr:type II secretion system GspH family protein [Kiritimatiellia bacterium]